MNKINGCFPENENNITFERPFDFKSKYLVGE